MSEFIDVLTGGAPAPATVSSTTDRRREQERVAAEMHVEGLLSWLLGDAVCVTGTVKIALQKEIMARIKRSRSGDNMYLVLVSTDVEVNGASRTDARRRMELAFPPNPAAPSTPGLSTSPLFNAIQACNQHT